MKQHGGWWQTQIWGLWEGKAPLWRKTMKSDVEQVIYLTGMEGRSLINTDTITRANVQKNFCRWGLETIL